MIKHLCLIATLLVTVTQVIALPVFDIENIEDSAAAGDNGVPQAAIDLIKEYEGLYLKAYNDPKTGGKPITIGWGSTKTLTGGEWKLGDSITKAQAEELLKHEILRRTLPGCKKIPTWNQMNDNQKGAIISFAYNLGENFYSTTANAFRTISTALSKTANWPNVPAALLLYVNPGSKVEAGLRRRRKAEAAVWNSQTSGVGITGDPGQPCKNGKLGVCGKPSSCKTSTVTGACNGGSDNVCCLGAAPTPTTPSTPSTGVAGDPGQRCKAGMPGVCGSSCSGVTVSGFCNGLSSNICCLPSTQSLWKSAFKSTQITFNDFHPSGVKDEATAFREARDAAAGKQATLSAYGNAPGGKTRLIPEMAAALLEISKIGKVVINEIAGGSHSKGSRHYAGVAIDIGKLNGKAFTYGVPEARQVINICRKFGADQILNINLSCGDACRVHNGWIHCSWPRSRAGKV